MESHCTLHREGTVLHILGGTQSCTGWGAKEPHETSELGLV